MTTPRPPARSQVVSPRVLGEAQGVLASMKALHHGQSASLVPPELGSCASSARVWRLWEARHSQSRGQATGSQPLPQVLELAASKVADSTAFDHVGGVKEKTIAAQRAGIKRIIFPKANRRDYDDLAENLRDGLEAHFAERYEDVFEIVFGAAAGPGDASA